MFRKIAVTAATVAVALLGLAGTAGARTASTAGQHGLSAQAARAVVASEVRTLLKVNPGARQVSPDSVAYKGAILGASLQARHGSVTPDSRSGVCPNAYVCLFWNYDFGQETAGVTPWIKFSGCGVNYDLYNYHVSTSQTWADETSSIDYPGSNDGREAKFNHDGDWWLYLYRDHYLSNLALNGGPSPQHNSNDWITGLYVC